MAGSLTPTQRADSGFTLLEVLVTIALMGLVVGTFATLTAQWLPNWKSGLLRAQRSEKVAIALDRLVADLSSARFITVNRLSKRPLFQGDEKSVTFVRAAVGPNGRRGMEFVQIAEIADGHGPALVRMHAPFVPFSSVDMAIERISFADPVVLLRAPLRVAFAYAGPDGKWSKSWRNAGLLPIGVRFVVLDERDSSTSLISTATRVHVDMIAPQPEPVSESAIDVAKPTADDAAGGR
jgi:general secretion pathway protein J